MCYLDALLLFGALRLEIGLVLVRALHAQEAVRGVADAAGQNSVPQHGVDYSALSITCSVGDAITIIIIIITSLNLAFQTS